MLLPESCFAAGNTPTLMRLPLPLKLTVISIKALDPSLLQQSTPCRWLMLSEAPAPLFQPTHSWPSLTPARRAHGKDTVTPLCHALAFCYNHERLVLAVTSGQMVWRSNSWCGFDISPLERLIGCLMHLFCAETSSISSTGPSSEIRNAGSS